MGGRSSISGVKVTIFGANGFLGRYLVNKLGQIGSQIVVPYRGNEYDVMHLKPLGDLGQINLQSFHLKDYPSIVSAVKNSDIVVNMIAQDRETRNFKAADVHVKGLLDIAKACSETNVSRLIHVSCGQVSKDSNSLIMKSRAEGEAKLREEFPDSIIVRSSTLFGHEDRFLRAIGGVGFSSLPFGFPVVNHGNAKRFPLYVGDLAEGLSRIVRLNSEHVTGKTFDLFGPKEYSYKQIVELFCYLACKPVKIVNLPPVLLGLYARMYPEWRRFVYTSDLIKVLSEDEKRVEGSLSWNELGMKAGDLKTLENDSLAYVRNYRHLEDYSRILPPLLQKDNHQ